MIRIAVDAMGGDHAPAEIIQGVLMAIRDDENIVCVLVGQENVIRELLDKEGDYPSDRIEIHPASEVVEMTESPVEALRRKPDSSIRIATGLVKEGAVQALVTAGNTGAAVAAALRGLRTLEGVRRPGIAIATPTIIPDGWVTLIDLGANLSPKPIHILQFAQMASVYSQEIYGVKDPKVALLNIGGEDKKGTSLVQEANTLLQNSNVNFVGYIEGQEIFTGAADVVVAEAWIGNTIIKVAEGFGLDILTHMRRILMNHVTDSESRVQLEAGLIEIRGLFDYAEYGGALLLGTEGIVVICHGRSEAQAIGNAVLKAARFASQNVNQRIVEKIAKAAA